MSVDVNVFVNRLAEIGVIDAKTAKAATAVMSKSYRDPQFPGLVNQMFEQVEGWHNSANSLSYTSARDFAIIVENGVKMIVKFAKANVSAPVIRTKNYTATAKKLAVLDTKFKEIEQNLILNPEGVKRMNIDIKKTSLDMLDTYQTGLTKIRASVNNPMQLPLIDQSLEKLGEIRTLVDAAADTGSKVAAKHQTEMFTYINNWEADFSVGNYSTKGVALLDKAIKAAKAWSVVPLKMKAKEATEADYVHADNIGEKMLAYATSNSAIENAVSLIEAAYGIHASMTNTEEAERQKAANAKDIETMQTRQQELTYLAQTGQMDVDDALDEADSLKETIDELKEANLDLSDEISENIQLRTRLKTTTDEISRTFKKLLQYKSNPDLINLASNYINFEALNNFLSGSDITHSLDQIMNITTIETEIKNSLAKATDEHKDILGQQRAERRQAREERRQQRQQRHGNDQVQTEESREEKLRRLAAMAGGAAAAPDNVVHKNTQYQNPQETKHLNLSELDN